MNQHESVTQWVHLLRTGDPDAAAQLWERYVQRVRGLARHRLANSPKKAFDEDDVAQSVFRSLCLGAADGEFPGLVDRDGLWPLLAQITNRKAANKIRAATRQKRGGGKVQGESVLDRPDDDGARGLEQMADKAMSPEFAAEMSEQCQSLLDALPDETYRFVVWKRLEGHSNAEIAELLEVTVRSIERKLQNARSLLVERLQSDGDLQSDGSD